MQLFHLAALIQPARLYCWRWKVVPCSSMYGCCWCYSCYMMLKNHSKCRNAGKNPVRHRPFYPYLTASVPASGIVRYRWSQISLALHILLLISPVCFISDNHRALFYFHVTERIFFPKMSSPKISRSKFSKEGSVVRVTMKNFMIYHHETIWPGTVSLHSANQNLR
jgi:hypothetical protein